MNRKWTIIGVSISVVMVCALMIGPIMSNVEHPKYKVINSSGNIEVREYAPMIIAEVEVSGERKQAINDGFRLLADYIFGNNTSQQDIAMSAPVQQQASEKLAMTAPVQQQEAGGNWRVSFVMPSKYSIRNLPIPNNHHVTLKEIPAKKFVVIEFSGANSAENIAEHEARLMEHISMIGLDAMGSPKYAFYNPPWTLPLMRRNEVMMEVAR